MEKYINAEMPTNKKIIVSGQRFDRQCGWQECVDICDDIELDHYTGTTMPEYAKTYLMEALFDNLDNHDLWDETDDTTSDYKIWLSLVDADSDDDDGAYATESYWATELAKDYLTYRLDLSRDIIDLACDILSNDTWDMDDLAKLCDYAGMSTEWNSSDDETFEEVVKAAAEKLDVRII